MTAIGILIVGALGLTTTALIRYRGAVRLSGHILCMALGLGVASGVYAIGHLHPLTSRWIALIPAIAVLCGGLRAGVIWFVLSWGAMLGLQFGLPLPWDHRPPVAFLDDPTHNVTNLTAFMILTLGLLAMSERIREWILAKLLTEEAQNKLIMDAFPEGVITLGAAKEVLTANPTARHMFDAFGEEALLDFARRMKSDRADWSDGEAFLEFERLVVDNAAGLARSREVLIIRDVTTARLDALTLRGAMEAASRASEAKTHFVATLSHEIRTPLNAVVGYAELLLDDAEEEDQEAVVEDVRSLQVATRYLLSLVSSTLDLAKIESGQLLLDITEVSIEAMTREVTRALRPTIEANGNTLLLDLDLPVDLSFYTDNLKLRQILMNLLSNAAKHTKNGRVILSTRAHDEQVVFQVIDDGEGMSPRTLERVWEEFVQADETALSQNGGTGLGLALVKQLTELLDGRIDVESVLGEGTTFTIALPHSPDSNNATSSESLGA